MEIVTEYAGRVVFRGEFPDIPAAPGVDLDDIRAMDGDPMFVSLAVVPALNAKSKNGLVYDESLMTAIETQINEKRPPGRFGHLAEAERDTAYPIPDSLWIGAKRIGDALWAKAYIPPGAAREYMRRLKAVGGSISTSIYGKGNYGTPDQSGGRRLDTFDLESLDFAPPERAALGHRAKPVVTTELEGTLDKNQIIAELTPADIPVIPATIREQIISTSTLVTELQAALTERNAAIAELRREQFSRTVETRIAELTNWQVLGDAAKAKLASLRAIIRDRVLAAANGDAANLDAVIEAAWTELQPLVETIRDALAGPPAVVGGGKILPRVKFEDTPAARAAARAEFSF